MLLLLPVSACRVSGARIRIDEQLNLNRLPPRRTKASTILCLAAIRLKCRAEDYWGVCADPICGTLPPKPSRSLVQLWYKLTLYQRLHAKRSTARNISWTVWWCVPRALRSPVTQPTTPSVAAELSISVSKWRPTPLAVRQGVSGSIPQKAPPPASVRLDAFHKQGYEIRLGDLLSSYRRPGVEDCLR